MPLRCFWHRLPEFHQGRRSGCKLLFNYSKCWVARFPLQLAQLTERHGLTHTRGTEEHNEWLAKQAAQRPSASSFISSSAGRYEAVKSGRAGSIESGMIQDAGPGSGYRSHWAVCRARIRAISLR